MRAVTVDMMGNGACGSGEVLNFRGGVAVGKLVEDLVAVAGAGQS